MPEVDRVTQGRTLAEADEVARDLISAMLEETDGIEVEPSAIELHLDIRLPDEVRTHLQQADELRDQAQQTQQAAAEEQAEAVRILRRAGVSLRDAGRALGLSHQRVGQLARR
ncbi:cell wall assembly regulator SMI1 [Saccharopolyspora lacisalsi]|uniref:Cell wall assembly regulator SMI1 n=1 Tax=Halosaccharopolyspora lacisalsi TaxID=1000566 RepID=A0A839DXZ9_9PSEU|nr:hypothetical protein [Halosaccharopolyspora lacisalsi]MBA8826842.1 cell wall assembly regulator SMI1 [Halosaccharopolyspora lacisalsi]